ncbi:MAG: LytR/AlgR family response regulator transcription factor [Gemmatimonadales bacterium]
MAGGELIVARVLIVDDERLARAGLRRELGRLEGIEVVGEAADGASAVDAIARFEPDLVFLDVQMPELDGFQVIAAVGPERMPSVIFLTAHDRYALRAFETDAIDYVLKPVDPARLARAVERALKRLQAPDPGALAAQLAGLLDRLGQARGEADRRIPVEHDGRFHFVPIEEIDWVEAAGNYVRLHTGRRVHRVRSTLEQIERRLGAGFLRVSRSALVGERAVELVEPFLKGSYVLLLRGGARVRTARSYRDRIEALLGRRR